MRQSPDSSNDRAALRGGRRRRGSARIRPLLTIIAVLAVTFGMGTGSFGSATGSVSEASVSAAPLATRVAVALATNPVKIGQRAAIRATLRPPVAGRTVVLTRLHGGRFVNLGRATTDRRGVATFRETFRSPGQVVLRATVSATPTYQSATSKRVIENVVIEYPFALASGTELKPGDAGPSVLVLQQRLGALGYWLGTPGGFSAT